MNGHESDIHLQPAQATTEKPAGKKKAAVQEKTAAQVIAQIFAVSLDKDQNVKPATLSKTDFKAIVGFQNAVDLNGTLADTVAAEARKTDPLLDTLAQLSVAASTCRDDAVRYELLAFCVRLASALWINRHRESLDLFLEILDSYNGLDATPLLFLRNSIAAQYSKRIESVRGIDMSATAANEASDSVAAPSRLTPAELARQRDNLQLIGGLWLLTNGRSDPTEAIGFFAVLLEERQSRTPSHREIALHLAGQYAKRGNLLADTLYYFEQKANEKAVQGKRLQSALEHSEQEVARLSARLAESKRANDQHMQQVSALEAEVARLQNALEEQQLDERAKRTHLRDNTGQVKARAFNLLSEDVLEPLKLSLSALQREKPKTEVAAHHIELAVESIERDIKWFKE